MTIGIIGAMPEEIAPLLEKFDCTLIEIAGNKYYLSNYANHKLIIAYSKIGKVNSTITATVLIEHFKCEAILFTGVAGSLRDDLKIKDILLAEKLVQHDVDISAFGYPYGFIPESPIFALTDKNLNNIALEVAKENDIELHLAIVATGDQFIKNEEKKQWIRNTFKADCVEMEGASVATVCNALKIPCLVLRTISDNAGNVANIDFDNFVVESSQISAEFIYKIIEKL